MKAKLYLILTEFKEKGLFYVLRRLTNFVFRPFANLIKTNDFLIELFFGYLSKIKLYIPFYSWGYGLIKFPKTELVKKVREFWYENIIEDFDLDGEKISRKDIFTYGGPNLKFTCSVCQKSEWLSRIRQKNLFISHPCSQGEECNYLCRKQGDEFWTHYHQNFDFSSGCDKNLSSPKCILYTKKEFKDTFFSPSCDVLALVNRRRLAYSCQIDVTDNPFKIDWSKYDFLFVDYKTAMSKFNRPNIPVILYGHDFWGVDKKIYQWTINWLKPDILLTAYPSCWSENFKFPNHTKIAFHPFFDSLFFSRPNLSKKDIDLLSIGAVTSKILYQPRIDLDKQISELSNRYKIDFSHAAGSGNVDLSGSAVRKDSRSYRKIRFLNKWSEYIGNSKYVIFGRMKYPVLVSKYYEVLGSGAIPIMPEVPDLKLLGVKPLKHYIPLSEVEGNNEKLSYYLDNYDKYKHIAENAVNWYKENSDIMIFNGFEDTIRNITNNKYPKRIV